ncbi:MAG TPA: transglycosylase SLT domain-containing protein [Thermoanaerobaculia bacterium]
MDPARQVSRRRTRVPLALAIVLVGACGRSMRVAEPPPLPAPIPSAPAPLPTLDDAFALRLSGDPAKYDDALRALTASTDQVTARRAQAFLALDLFDRKQYADAIPALQAAATADPAIAPYLQRRILEAGVNMGNLADAITTASTIIATAPASSAATVTRLQLPGLYAAAGDDANMDLALQQVAVIPIDELTEGDFVSLASKLAKAGKADRAADIRMRILRDYPQGRYTEEVYSDVQSATPSPLDALSTEDATKLASKLAGSNRYDQALDLLQRIGTRGDAATSALYKTVRVRALFNSRNYAQLLKETSADDRDPAIALTRARAAWRADDAPAFLAGLDRIEQQFPKSKEAIEAKLLRAKYYVTDEVDYARSTENLQKAVDSGATGTDGENIWTLGFTYVLWGKYDDALRTFDRCVREYPDGDYRTNALFWSAKIHERHGNTAERDAALDQLIVEYPYNYYAYRAREILGSSPTENRVPRTEDAVFPNLDAELAKISDPRLDAVRELLAVDLERDATREMKSLAAAYPENAGVQFMLADVYARGGEAFEAINIVQRRFRPFVRHGGSNIPQRFWQILFPLTYWDTIRAEAEKRNLDPYLVASIIRQESGFEPTIVSNAGAVGLMQIMPAEASRIASEAGIPGISRERLFDPVTNIAVGTAEYSQKLASMRGNHILAIAAYNAGEDAVGRWLAQTPVDGDPDLFVESIPYAETRLYVKTVTRNRFEYRRVYERSTVSQAVGPVSTPPR